MIGFILITLLFIGAIVGFQKLLDIEKIKADWPKYRCRPDVMLMANLYGHDAGENLDFCLGNGFNERAKGAIGPFYTYLAKFVSILVTLLNSINSIRMTFATIIGSITQVFSEFSQRMQAFFYSIQTKALRIKFLMQRVFATMTSILFMGMSGIRATTNFGNTFLFKFLDTFCFDPDTPVEIQSKGKIPIKDVRIGDIFEKTGDRVTATFQFAADGQEMVQLKENILVSTNHFLLDKRNEKWIHAAEHPDAQPWEDWSGGVERPLICLNTESHSFPLGPYLFRDYDETEEGDQETMQSVLKQLNGAKKDEQYPITPYSTCIHPETLILTVNGKIPASKITLGTQLPNGVVQGIVKKEVDEICQIGESKITSGCAVWSDKDLKWVRASQIAKPRILQTSQIFFSFVVTPSAFIETGDGLCVRDYVEIHSPDTENAYAQILRSQFNHTPQLAGC